MAGLSCQPCKKGQEQRVCVYNGPSEALAVWKASEAQVFGERAAEGLGMFMTVAAAWDTLGSLVETSRPGLCRAPLGRGKDGSLGNLQPTPTCPALPSL